MAKKIWGPKELEEARIYQSLKTVLEYRIWTAKTEAEFDEALAELEKLLAE